LIFFNKIHIKTVKVLISATGRLILTRLIDEMGRCFLVSFV